MECSCVIEEIAEDGLATMLSDTTPRARKTHRCGECGREITVGERYRRESYVFEGEIETAKTCLDCISIRDAFFCTWAWGGIFESLFNEMDGAGCDLPESCIAELTPRAMGHVCEMIEKCWDRA